MLPFLVCLASCMAGHTAITEVSLRKDLGGGVQAEVVSTYLGPDKEDDLSWLTPRIKATAGTNLPVLIENRKYRGPVITDLYLIQNESRRLAWHWTNYYYGLPPILYPPQGYLVFDIHRHFDHVFICYLKNEDLSVASVPLKSAGPSTNEPSVARRYIDKFANRPDSARFVGDGDRLLLKVEDWQGMMETFIYVPTNHWRLRWGLVAVEKIRERKAGLRGELELAGMYLDFRNGIPPMEVEKPRPAGVRGIIVHEQQEGSLRMLIAMEMGTPEEVAEANARLQEALRQDPPATPQARPAKAGSIQRFTMFLVDSNNTVSSIPWRHAFHNPNEVRFYDPRLLPVIRDAQYSATKRAVVVVHEFQNDVTCDYVDHRSPDGRPLQASHRYRTPNPIRGPLSAVIEGHLDKDNLRVRIAYGTNRVIQVKWTGNEWETSEGRLP